MAAASVTGSVLTRTLTGIGLVRTGDRMAAGSPSFRLREHSNAAWAKHSVDLCKCTGRIRHMLQDPIRVCSVDAFARYVELVKVALLYPYVPQVRDGAACLFHRALVAVQAQDGTRRPVDSASARRSAPGPQPRSITVCPRSMAISCRTSALYARPRFDAANRMR